MKRLKELIRKLKRPKYSSILEKKHEKLLKEVKELSIQLHKTKQELELVEEEIFNSFSTEESFYDNNRY